MPALGALNTEGLDLGPQQLAQLLHVDWNAWAEECLRSGDFLAKFGRRLPQALQRERAALMDRLKSAQA